MTKTHKGSPTWDFVGYVGGVFLDALLLMLLLGDLHVAYHQVPAVGYWLCVFASWVIALLVATGTNSLWARLKYLTPHYGKEEPKPPARSPIEDLFSRDRHKV